MARWVYDVAGKRDDADRLPYRGRVALDIFKRSRIELHRTDYPISKSHQGLHRRAWPGALSVAQSTARMAPTSGATAVR